MRAWQIAGAALLAALGAVAGYELRGAPPAPAAAPAPGPALQRVVTVPTGGVRLEDIRAIVREELRRREGDAPEAAAPATAAPPPPPQVAAAEGHLDGAMARGVWTEDDRQRLVGELPDLPGPDRERLLQRLAQAMNEGTLVLAPDARPL